MRNKIKNKKINVIYIISFIVLIMIFVFLLILTKDSKKIIEINEFIKTDTKVLYITKDNKLNYPIKILETYNIDYLKIDSSNLSIFETKKLKKIIDNKKLNNILVVFKSGKIDDTMIVNNSEEKVNEFLQNTDVIPDKIVSNVKDIVNDINNIFNSSYSMVYIPYKEIDVLKKQDDILKSIADKYAIEYKRIDAYLLSNNQKEKINKLLGISAVEDQILILIKDNKMVANIRGTHRKNTYIQKLYEANFINELENKVNKINYKEFEEKIKNKEKSIILIGNDKLKDSNEVLSLLNDMIYNYNINIDYIDVENEDSNIYNKIKEKVENIGYFGAFSLPLVIIVESNNVLDYAIGNSKEDYFLDIFIENGVIKGEVINE